jgi:hypothetical protein
MEEEVLGLKLGFATGADTVARYSEECNGLTQRRAESARKSEEKGPTGVLAGKCADGRDLSKKPFKTNGIYAFGGAALHFAQNRG